jgi:hypothetical protein
MEQVMAKAHFQESVCMFLFYSQQILIKIVTGESKQKLAGELKFMPCKCNVTHALHEARIRIYISNDLLYRVLVHNGM